LIVVAPSAVIAEQDHILCSKGKDFNKIKLDLSVFVNMGGFLNGNCRVKGKVAMHCGQAEKDGADDPRGSAPGDFLCYKVKCDDFLQYSIGLAESQFALHSFGVSKSKTKLLCAPMSP
jgi:hypothetical protein